MFTSALKSIITDKFFRQSALIFGFVQAGAFFNFLFQYELSQELTKADFGLLNSLLSFYVILLIPVTSFQYAISKFVSEYRVLAQKNELKYFFSILIKYFLIVSVLLTSAFFILSGMLSHFFHVPSRLVFISLAWLSVSGIFIYIGIGFLQGLQDFYWMGMAFFLVGFLKWASAHVIFLKNSYSLFNLISTIAIVSTFIASLIFYHMRKLWVWSAGIEINLKEKLRFFIPTFLSYAIFSIMFSIDLVLLQHFWGDSSQAPETGLYATAVILGKTVFYVAVPIIMVMFPKVSENVALEKSSSSLFLKAFGSGALIAGGALFVFFLFPEWILEFFGKKSALAAVPYLQWYAVCMFFMVLLQITVNYCLALSHFGFIKILLAAVTLEIGSIILFHQNVYQVIFILLATITVSLGLCLVSLWSSHKLIEHL